MRLRAPAFPCAGVVFAARSLFKQRFGPDRITCRAQLDRHSGRLSFRRCSAVLGRGCVPASRVPLRAGRTLVSVANRAGSDCQNFGRDLAADVCPGLTRHSAGPCALDGRDSDRGISRTYSRRPADPLPERGRRLHRLHHGSGSRALPDYSIFVLCDSSLGAHSIRVLYRTARALERLAGRTRAHPPAEGTGKAARGKTGCHGATRTSAGGSL